MCFDNSLLKPMNQCNYTDLEYTTRLLYELGDHFILCHFDKQNRARLIISDISQNNPLSGLLLEHLSKRSGYIVKGVYTDSKERRKGLAKLLLLTARQHLGKVRHSEYMTIEGERWMNSIENIPD